MKIDLTTHADVTPLNTIIIERNCCIYIFIVNVGKVRQGPF